MYLKYKPMGDLVEILDLEALINPVRAYVMARLHSGEELQDPEDFSKSELAFPSGEELPRCWKDVHYRA